MEEQELEQKERIQVFEYLNKLRASGKTNMFGAGIYLQREFNMSRVVARRWLTRWMATFIEGAQDGS